MNLPNRAKELRVARGISVTEMSRRTGLTRQSIYWLEQDSGHNPSATTMQRYADVLGLSVGEVFFGEAKV